MSMKNPLTPAGIEPATFRFVAQHLSHCDRGPRNYEVYHIIKNKLISKTLLCLVIKYIQTRPLSESMILLGTCCTENILA